MRTRSLPAPAGWGVWLVAALAVALVGCSDSPERVEATRGSASDATTDAEGYRAVFDFAGALARSPFYAGADYGVPRDARAWAEGSIGILQGDIVSVEAGPNRPVTIGPDEMAVTLGQRTIAITISVTTSSGEIARTPESGDAIDVLVPVWNGPNDGEASADDPYVQQLIDNAPPSGTDLLVAVGSIDDKVAEVAHVTALIASDDRGEGATILSAPQPDGSVWGMRSVNEIAASLRD